MKNSLLIIGVSLAMTSSCAGVACKEPFAVRTNHARVLGESDVAFGESQLEAMVRDRPKMEEFAKRGDPIWTWAAKQFAGEYTGTRYYWNGDPVYRWGHRSIAMHCVPSGKNAGYVTVCNSDEDGYTCSPERMWAAVIFELFNIRYDGEFRELVLKAKVLSKAEFIRGFAQCEYEALKQVGPFYKSVVEPNSSKSQRPVYEYWHLELPPTFDQWFSKQKRSQHYMDTYGQMFDDFVAGRIKQE
jgi:hypothetical protein